MASEDISGRESDPLAASLRSGETRKTNLPRPPAPTFVGFLDCDDDADHVRLYLGAGAYVEFRADDVEAWSEVPPDQSPVLGEKATAVRLKPEARLSYTREEVAEHFDLKLHVYDVPADDLAEFAQDELVFLTKVTGTSHIYSCRDTKRTCNH